MVPVPTNFIVKNRLSYTTYTLYDEFYVIWPCFFPSVLANFSPPGSGSVSRKPMECGSNSDPDPKHDEKVKIRAFVNTRIRIWF
jgi:hypothetical protein